MFAERVFDHIRHLRKVFEQADSQTTTDFVPLVLSREFVDSGVERRIWGDRDAMEADEASGREDVSLDA